MAKEAGSHPWWRGAVVYQVYIRSFCDSNGDGQGDLAGLISKLDYIQTLGVDAIWLSPVHPSPNRDWGYDVADYDGVHPDYGTLADFEALLRAAHARGLKVILDEVLCHTSDEHTWFRESLDAKSDKRDWFVWADPKPDGTVPNNWLAVFGGPGWAYRPERRQYYHHKFLRQQPKLAWTNADAKRAALKVLEDWLARGVDGFRLDVANAYLHDAALTDNPPVRPAQRTAYNWSHAANMQEHLHDSNLFENRAELDVIRRTVEKFDDRFVFGEFSEEFERSGAYLSPAEGLHAGYTFALLIASKLSPSYIRNHLEDLARFPDHRPCMSFSNHDVVRTVTRFGGAPDGDPALAKLLFALLGALRGTILIYQGEELGLPEVDLARDQLKDPVGDLYYPVAKGRDGCRTPMPWDASARNLGFSTGTPWLPLGPAHKALAVSEQTGNADSPLEFARHFLAGRKKSRALRLGDVTFLDADKPILAFIREAEGERMLCIFNLSREDARFTHPLIAKSAVAGLGCGNSMDQGATLHLGPLACRFAEL
ncbi:MAG TPA: alpha-amylase family glycosyl hydrolase [Rhizomicrobium sp.]|jgi:alpha-glucosidase|nr:alpha-amylase family glycosyl hydrolase [Rhizomicrobium sp.]